jgi:hypothetical protein
LDILCELDILKADSDPLMITMFRDPMDD